jgi:hypothetical protein
MKTPSTMTLDELRAETENAHCIHCGLGRDLDHSGCGTKIPSHTPGPWATGFWDDGNVEPHVEMVSVISPKSKHMNTEICAMRIKGKGLANATLIAAAPEMLMALKAVLVMVEKALPKFNWGASALDAQAIRLLNETPGHVRRAILKAEGK